MRVRIPANGWQPRGYQLPAWVYLQEGGQHAELIWHRRSGKDDVCLHRTCVAAHERVANYWHMLPLANQARKAVWNAVNPHTGNRRIDEAFPKELRESTQDHEMYIRFKNGSSWQVLGSDNYEGSIGSSPSGIVYSEWAQSNPEARAYLRPILAENHGWQVFITTPRGKNHAWRTYRAAKESPGTYAELLTALQTDVFTPEELETERASYIQDFGEDMGNALYEQEYLCSFEAAILGSYYGAEFARIDKEGRICKVEYDEAVPVYTAWDLGYDDDTAIWWYQVVRGEIHVLECYYSSGKDIGHYAEIVSTKLYKYAKHWLPHDARAKTLAAAGKSIVEQLAGSLGWKNLGIVPNLSVQDGIQAVRKAMPRVWFDTGCEEGVEAMRQYQREWDDDKKMFRDRPRHDWCVTSDTKVLTRYGMSAIMDLPYTGEVLTSCGWKKYWNPRTTRKNAQLVAVTFKGGYTVRCTPDHPFLTASGWKYAEDLKRGSLIRSSLTPLRSILMAACIGFGLEKSIMREAAKSFTVMCGKARSALSPLIVTYTTLTETRPTTGSQTLSACLVKNTFNCPEQERKGIFRHWQGKGQQIGIGQKQAGCGIEGTPNEQKAGQSGSVKPSRVGIAEKQYRLSYALGILRNTALQIVRPLRIERVEKLDYVEDVWCLTVPDNNEFSIENGAIVHNTSHFSDAFRYLAIAWKAEAEETKPEKGKTIHDMSLNDLWEAHEKYVEQPERI